MGCKVRNYKVEIANFEITFSSVNLAILNFLIVKLEVRRYDLIFLKRQGLILYIYSESHLMLSLVNVISRNPIYYNLLFKNNWLFLSFG
jgi:hypothetical protein